MEVRPQQPPAAVAGTSSGSAATALSADPNDYSVDSNGKVEVQGAETLGHYAEWLGVRASRLRSLNSLRYGQPVELSRGGNLKRQAAAATRKWAEGVAAFLHEHPEMWWNWLDKRWMKILRQG